MGRIGETATADRFGTLCGDSARFGRRNGLCAQSLSEYRTRTRHSGTSDFVFPTAGGRADSASNVRTRFLAPAVKLANVELEQAGEEPIGAVTPHSLRRTFISLLLATGADVPYVMAQAGHRDPKMTLGIYAQVIASKADHGQALDALVAPVSADETLTAA